MKQKNNKNLLRISEAAHFLGVSINTLRLWDKVGKLKALKSENKHRYYRKEELELFQQDIFALARIWAESQQPSTISPDFHCLTQDIFRARLSRFALLAQEDNNIKDIIPLVTAIVGEIGNNSYDHNLGNWPDMMGIFFAYDLNKRTVVLADRGVGIRATLSRVRPELKDDVMALIVALTEKISGRLPELRGNGLKFVRNSIIKYSLSLFLQSGNAVAEIRKEDKGLKIRIGDRFVRGTLTKIIY